MAANGKEVLPVRWVESLEIIMQGTLGSHLSPSQGAGVRLQQPIKTQASGL